MILTYQKLPGIPDAKQAVLYRMFTNEDDADAIGRKMADEMKARPPGQRVVLAADFLCGATPALRKPFYAKDEEDVGTILSYGCRPLTLAHAVCHVHNIFDAYAGEDGPPLDWLICNLEDKPGRWRSPDWPIPWAGVKGYAGLAALDDDAATIVLERWANRAQRLAVETALVQPYRLLVDHDCVTKIGNAGACNWSRPHADQNGWPFHDAAPCGISMPFLYLNDATKEQELTAKNMLAHNLNALAAVSKPVLAWLCPPGFNGSGKVARDVKAVRSAWLRLCRDAIRASGRDIGFWLDGSIGPDNAAIPWTAMPVKDASGSVVYAGKRFEGEEAALVADGLMGRL